MTYQNAIHSHAIRTATFDVVAGAEGDANRIPVVISTDAVVRVGGVDEILVHSTDAVDLTRSPLPIIVTHRANQINIGNVVDITISNGQMRGFAVFGERQEALEYRRDVENGTIRSVSLGYRRIRSNMRSDGVMVTSRWQPTHNALVAEPADTGTGFYRAADEQPDVFELVVETTPIESGAEHRAIPPAGPAGTQTKERSMPDATIETTAPAIQSTAGTSSTDYVAEERSRMKQIRELGRSLEMGELAERAIDAGHTVDQFRAQVLDNLKAAGKIRPAESPEIGMSKKDIEEFSFCRALMAAADPANAHKIAGFELECSRAAQDARGGLSKDREHALTIPVDVLARGLSMNDHMAGAIAGQLIQRANARGDMHAYRDLVAGTASAGGNLVATDLLGSSFIDLLRNAMVLDTLGVTWLRDLNGNVAIPSQTGAATAYWFTEGNAPTESQQAIGQTALTPKTVGAFTDYSRRLLLQSSLDVEMFVRADLAAVIGQAIQSAAINGAVNGPTGLLATSGIGSVAGGTNGAAPTYDHMVDLETALANANADGGNVAYLTNTKVRGKLRKTQEFASTNGKPVWTSAAGLPGVGEVLGYNAYTTNAVPSNLTKGSASGICSATILANWSDMLIGMWAGLDLMLDPYALSTSGGKRVIALQDCDVQLRRVASFAAMQDALTT